MFVRHLGIRRAENETAETCEHLVNYQEVTLLFSSQPLSAVAGEIVQQFFCYLETLSAVTHTSRSSRITESLFLLKSQVNKWKVFAFVLRAVSPASGGGALDLETMCCGLLFPSLPL